MVAKRDLSRHKPSMMVLRLKYPFGLPGTASTYALSYASSNSLPPNTFMPQHSFPWTEWSSSTNPTMSHSGRMLLIAKMDMRPSLALPPNGKSSSCLDISESLDNGFHFYLSHARIERKKDHRVSRLFGLLQCRMSAVRRFLMRVHNPTA